MILLIDNYDSFVHNLARYLTRLGCATRIVRNDALTVNAIREMRPSAIVLSPGPYTPTEAGISLELVRELSPELPILGVCLGHQTIAAAFGGRVTRAREPFHGRTSEVYHDGKGLFAGLENPIIACRYHSLVVSECDFPDELQVTAITVDGVMMALQHRQLPVFGVQFHPESVLTSQGYELLANFLQLAGHPCGSIPSLASEIPPPRSQELPWPKMPVTF